ncbi:hypothetical protein ID850_17650, partial [Xenorhabdus sp. Flor]|nr:hypothetical protein [Xenorhabdus sp. Flor]
MYKQEQSNNFYKTWEEGLSFKKGDIFQVAQKDVSNNGELTVSHLYTATQDYTC